MSVSNTILYSSSACSLVPPRGGTSVPFSQLNWASASKPSNVSKNLGLASHGRSRTT